MDAGYDGIRPGYVCRSNGMVERRGKVPFLLEDPPGIVGQMLGPSHPMNLEGFLLLTKMKS